MSLKKLSQDYLGLAPDRRRELRTEVMSFLL